MIFERSAVHDNSIGNLNGYELYALETHLRSLCLYRIGDKEGKVNYILNIHLRSLCLCRMEHKREKVKHILHDTINFSKNDTFHS